MFRSGQHVRCEFDREADSEGARILELAFESRSLRTLCESEAHAKRELGEAVAEILKRRLADLRAATSVNDLLAGRPRVLDGTERHHMAVDLPDGYRIVFSANHSNNPVTDAGGPDWARISRIKILRVERGRA